MIERALELYARRGWTAFDFQREAWDAYAAGESMLVHAPTGLGKTEAAYVGPVLEELATPSAERGLRVLWITPLRALARDLVRHLETTASDMGLDWRTEVRCSDTPERVRRKQRERLPEVLVTTPESLSLMLSWSDGEARLAGVRCVVVDEWHELMSTKRGVQVELALARLRALSPSMRTIGLSASLGHPERALEVLVPDGATRKRLIGAGISRPIDIATILPEESLGLPWAGHLGFTLLPSVVDALEPYGTSLVFTTTRYQAEAWFHRLLEARPDWAGLIALHHGSMDRKLREGVERLLVAQRLKVVVCTSSFDLGVDFPAVEQVVQIGSPKGLARFVQRAGRSGHRPGATPRIVCVPTHAIELAEFSAAREALSRGEIEPRTPLEMTFDVLVQHVVTLASGAGLDPEATFHEVRRTHAFRDLARDDWEWTIDFAGRGGATLAAYPQFARLVERDGRYVASSDRMASLHRVNIGTIVAEGTVEVRMERGGRLGEVEESFASRRKPGEQIRFAGRALEVVALNGMRMTVRRARTPSETAMAPRWMGAKMPLSSHLGRALRRELARPASEWSSRPELAALAPLLALQQERSRLPGPDEMLIELSEMRGQHMACVFPFEGRNVHEGMSALVAWRLAQQRASSLSTTVTDYGFALQSRHPFPDDPTVWPMLLSPDDLEADLAALLAGTDYARRQFRYVARVAGLLVQGWPGQKRRLRDLQASSSLIHAVFERYDPTNRLLAQARREVLEHEFELTRLRAALERMASSKWNVVVLERLSPLSFPLWAEWSRGEVSSEAWEDRVQRMALAQDDSNTSAPIPAAPVRRRAWR